MSEEQPARCREIVIQTLEVLSSADRQLAYEDSVPRVSVTNELVSLWFDDTYLPESPIFRSSFTQEELLSLAAFNEYYDQQEKLLPEPRNGVADWLNDETWKGIMREASKRLLEMPTSATHF